MFLKYTLFAACALLISCATTHPGKPGMTASGAPSKLPLKISAKTLGNPNQEAFQLLEVTLENTSDKWLRLDHNEVIIAGDLGSQMSVVIGKDLKTWAEAAETRARMEDQNKQVLQTGLILGGTVVAAAAGKDSKVRDLGALAVLGGYGWAVADVITGSITKAEGVDAVPENHLYKPVSVPGKMFLRRWVLINKPSNTVLSKVALQFETVEGEKDTYVVPLL